MIPISAIDRLIESETRAVTFLQNRRRTCHTPWDKALLRGMIQAKQNTLDKLQAAKKVYK